jgi:hypothetical protein
VTVVEANTRQAELQDAYEHYRSAMRSWRSAAKAGNAEATERAAELLLTARVTLYRSLLATGWVPPQAVEVQLDRDAALLDAPAEFDPMLAGL